MIGDYRFFQDFFDGQIVQKPSEKFKMFKLTLFSVFACAGLFLYLMGWCNFSAVVLLFFGMTWNIYLDINKKSSFIMSILVAGLYFYYANVFNVFANALIYVCAYIPLQLIALTKDYEAGAFVQIKKKINDDNKILFFIFFSSCLAILILLGVGFGGRFIMLDGLTAALLVSSAVLRNERYFEYYLFRTCALIFSITLWILIYIEYLNINAIVIVLMYSSYLIFDLVNYVVSAKTYINEYMLEVAKYKKQEEKKLIKQKLEAYKNKQN